MYFYLGLSRNIIDVPIQMDLIKHYMAVLSPDCHVTMQVSDERELPGHFLSMSGGATMSRRHSTERQGEAVVCTTVLATDPTQCEVLKLLILYQFNRHACYLHVC